MCRAAGAMQTYTPAQIAAATGGYHPLAVIGEGGFGKVYRAMVHKTPVAIKVMDSGGLQGLGEFDNEVRLLSHLAHPHIVKLLGVCRQEGLRCLVYELMPCGNLEDRLACRGGARPVPWTARARIAAQIAAALAHLHAAQPAPIIHRDVKPANMFLDSDLGAKLGDVGLASAQGESPLFDSARKAQQQNGDAIGTWPYLPPEYKTKGHLSPKADVYAFGLSLLQIVTGVEAPNHLLERVRGEVSEGREASLLDRKAGDWDVGVGDRLLAVGLWCCCDTPEERPVMGVVAQELGKLWAAVEQCVGAPAQQRQTPLPSR